MSNQNKEISFTDLVNGLLAKMPSDFEKWVIKNITFVFPKQNNLAHTVSKCDSKHFEAMICLFDELLTKDKRYQEFCLLHEIAHIKLKHKTPKDVERKQKQEDEANALALKWWTEAQNSDRLRKMQSVS